MKFFAGLLLCACSTLCAQEALTLEAVAADPKIWPVEVMVTVDHKLPVIIGGKVAKTLKVGPGNMYKVKAIAASGVTVMALGGPKTFAADDTDVIARVGQIIARRAPLAAATQTSASSPVATQAR